MKYRKLVKQLNNLQLFRIFMERRNKTVRKKTKKKAFVSVLLSFVMIMGLFFVPKVNAEEQPDQPNTISFKQVEKDMDMVDGIILRVDGNDQETPISYPAGLISENIGSLNLPENQEFQKAVVKDATTQTETEIARIGTYEEKIYYSLTDQQDIGITLKDGQSIVLICATQYTVTYQTNGNGTITGPQTILNGENLNITVKANDCYHIESVTMNGDNLSLSSENSKNESIQIESSKIKGNITINATFEYDTSYRIIEKNAWIEDEHYHGYTDEDDPKGGIQQGDVCWNDDTEVIEDVNPGGSVTFWLYSQSNSGGKMWRLNMLKFNDENINVPLKYYKGAQAETTLSNGSIVTITLIEDDYKIEWKDDWWDTSTKRTIYEVHIDHVKESIDISGNFKDASKSEIMLTGLEGIQTSGMAKETSGLKNILPPYDTYYYYDFQSEDGDKVYDAYYTDPNDGESYNIILYSVKPGYNPYTLNLSAIYDGNTIENIESILQNNSNSIQYDINSIAKFIDDESKHRFFGTANSNMGILSDINPSSIDEWIATAKDAGHTYGIILKQNEAKNQIININANPYQYNLIFDLNGGNGLDSMKYRLQDNNYVEVDSKGKVITYTLKDGSANAYMPIQNPTRAGHIFLGWQLYYNGDPVEEVDLLTSNQTFTINEETIKYSDGDPQKDTGHTFTFEAVWATETESAEDTIYTIYIYYEQPDGQYVLNNSYSDIGIVGEEMKYIGDKDKYNSDKNLYYLNEDPSKSKLTIDKLLDEKNPDYKDNNAIKLYYSYYRYNLTVTKDAVGDYADLSRDWTIDVTLTNENDSSLQDKKFEDGSKSIQLDNGQGQLSLKDEESFTFANLIKGTQFKVEEKDVPTDYEVTYKINNDEKDSVSNQSLTSDTTVTVINKMNDESIIPGTNIPTSGMNNTITMLAIGSLGIIGIVTLLWYWRKKHV